MFLFEERHDESPTSYVRIASQAWKKEEKRKDCAFQQ